jgi:uncharacterized protein YgbK (DUF1537 family)
VMAGDARRAPGSSRPADHLRSAGLPDVVDRVPVDGVANPWMAGGSIGVVVPDVEGWADLDRLATALMDRPSVLFAGTAEAIARWAAVGRDATATPASVAGVGAGSGASHVVAVVGSRHPQAVQQVAALRASADPSRVTLVVAPPVDPGPIEPGRADQMATHLAAESDRAVAEQLRSRPDARVVRVIIGGDTAAAVLGDGPRLVLGTIGPGTSRSVGAHDTTDEVVTRAGSFGDDDALAVLVARLLQAAPIEG